MQLLTIKEVANKCKMSVKWVEKSASLGNIPLPIYLDGHKRWREKDIDEWIQAGCPPIQAKIPQKNSGIDSSNLNLKVVEIKTIKNALFTTKGNREKAAQLLGIGERTLYRKIKEYQLD